MSKPAKASNKLSHKNKASRAARKSSKSLVSNRGSDGSAEGASKQQRVIDLLRSPNGATIAAMMRATKWQQHSVRGFLAGVVRKKLKLKLDSTKVDGERTYRITDDAKPKDADREHRRAAA